MALVGVEGHGAIGLVEDDELYGGGASVDADGEVSCLFGEVGCHCR